MLMMVVVVMVVMVVIMLMVMVSVVVVRYCLVTLLHIHHHILDTQGLIFQSLDQQSLQNVQVSHQQIRGRGSV